MKRLLSMLAILALCTPLALTQPTPGPPAPTPAPAPAPTSTLEVKGADVQYKLPVTVKAQAADFYTWAFPAGVTATSKGDTLEVTAAPSGKPIAVSVTTVTIDWAAKKTVPGFGAATFTVGGAEPTPDPDPIDTTDAALSLPAELHVDIGKGSVILQAVIKGNRRLRWLHAPDLDDKLQIFEYPNHAVLTPIKGGVFYIGGDLVSNSQPAQWCRVTVGGGPSPLPSSLAERITAAFDADVKAGKGTADDKTTLAAIFRNLTLDTLKQIPTMDKVRSIVDGSVKALLIGRLPTVVEEVNGYLAIMIPDWKGTGPVSDPARLVSAFGDINSALGVAPGPTPTAANPFGSGKRIMIVYESGTEGALAPSQRSIFTSTKLFSFAKERGIDLRVVDQNSKFGPLAKVWQDAMARPHSTLPWILVGKDASGTEEPLPANIDATLTLLARFFP